MPFSSVRLTHAHGIPHHYITNQVYIPSDEDHLARGCFLIVCEHSHGIPKTFVTTLINTLIREYYRQTGDQVTAFEQTLIRINEQLNHGLSAHETTGDSLINGSIVLVTDGEIHLTHIGNPGAYLVRHSSVLSLVDADAQSSRFSMITSGEVKKDDLLVLLSNGQLSDTISDDIQFAATHEPLTECGRALARVLKQASSHHVEGVTVAFEPSEEIHTSIAIDKPLESPTETLATVQKNMKRHADLIVSGVHFLAETALRSTKKSAAHKIPHEELESETPLPEPTYDEFIQEESDEDMITSEEMEETKHITPPAGTYTVKHYWQTESSSDNDTPEEHEESHEETSVPNAKASALEEEEEQEVAPEATIAALRPRSFALPRISLPKLSFNLGGDRRSQLIYTVIAVVLVVGIIIRIGTAITNRSANSETAQDEATRTALFEEATAAARDAETAQFSDDTPTAIDHLLTAQIALGKISDDKATEAMKSLKKQVNESLKNLTKAVELTKVTGEQTVSDTPTALVTTGNGTYVSLENNTLVKYTESALKPIEGLPTGSEITAMTAYDGGQKLAVLVSLDNTPKLYSLTTTTDALVEVKRADNKAWPSARLLASFEKNLYFVGDTMFKALPNSDTVFRVIAYAATTNTSNLSSITVNGGIFYAMENKKDLVRITSNSPKTPIKLFGVPESFLPKTFGNLMTNPAEGVLSLFDVTNQRVLTFSTDGSYRKQTILPTGSTYTNCDATTSAFVCTTQDKKVKTIAF